MIGGVKFGVDCKRRATSNVFPLCQRGIKGDFSESKIVCDYANLPSPLFSKEGVTQPIEEAAAKTKAANWYRM